MDNATSRDFLYDFGRDRYMEACALVGITNPQVRFSGDTSPANKDPVPNGTHWARFHRQVVDERQESLRLATRRFVTNGLFRVQLFGPVTDTKAQHRLDRMAEYIRNAFRSYQHADCDFTTAEINDNVPNEPAWVRSDIVSNYQFRQFIS